jgi:hypothetical protein
VIHVLSRVLRMRCLQTQDTLRARPQMITSQSTSDTLTYLGVNPLVSMGSIFDMLNEQEQPLHYRSTVDGQTASSHDCLASDLDNLPVYSGAVHEDKIPMPQMSTERLALKIISEETEEHFQPLPPIDKVCLYSHLDLCTSLCTRPTHV